MTPMTPIARLRKCCGAVPLGDGTDDTVADVCDELRRDRARLIAERDQAWDEIRSLRLYARSLLADLQDALYDIDMAME